MCACAHAVPVHLHPDCALHESKAVRESDVLFPPLLSEAAGPGVGGDFSSATSQSVAEQG